MRPRNHLDRIHITFDDHRLVNNAGLLLPATLALHLGLSQLVDRRLDLGRAPGRANTGDKMMTLVASALAGGDCIDDADALRAGGTACTLGSVVKAPSTLGAFLRSFRWGHVRQLDWVSRELLARAWQAGAGPGDAPFTIDLDSTICETYGLAKEGARHHGYTGARGYHPLLAVAAGTGDVLMSRCARAAPTPPAGPPTSCGRRWGGCATLAPAGRSPCGPTAASIPTPWSPSAASWTCASPSPSASTKACAISSRPYPKLPGRRFPTGWTAPPLWPRRLIPPSRVSRTPRRCGSSSGGCSRPPVPNWPSSPPTVITASSPTGTERPWNWRRPPPPRRDRECDTRPQVRRRVEPLPSGRFAANGAWLAVQVMSHNLARWTARIALGEQIVTTKTLRRRFFSLAGRLTRSARRSPCICPSAGLGKPSSVAPWPGCAPCHSQPDDPLQLTRHPAN